MAENLLYDPSFEFMIGLTNDEITTYLKDSIRRNTKNKLTLIKHAHTLGVDLSTIIDTAIRFNDIITIAYCFKLGFNIHYTTSDYTFIHVSIMENNTSLIKFFIMKGVDIDKINGDGHTALEIAMDKEFYNCVEILVENGANLFLTINEIDNEQISLMEILLNIYEPKFEKLFELVVSKTNVDSIICTEDLFFILKKYLMLKNYDLVETILCKFPKFVNKVVQGCTLLLLLMEKDQKSTINKIIKLKSVKLNPKKIVIPYLHKLCSINDTENILYILDNDPTSIARYCEDNRTPIDHVILTCSNYSEDTIINTINILLNKSTTDILNNRNIYGIRTIETAIQFTNAKIIKFLLDNGCNINDKIIDKTIYFPCATNNDPLAFASQLDKPEIIDVLLKYNVNINLYDGMPTAILNAIDHNSVNAINTLMSYDVIVNICNDELIKNKLLNFCVNVGIGNNEIMKYFTNPETLASININTNTLIFNRTEKHLESYFDHYHDNKYEILSGLRDALIFFKYCSLPKSKETHNQLIDMIEKYFYAVSNNYFNTLKNFVFQICLTAQYMEELKICLNNMNIIARMEDLELVTMAWNTIVEIQSTHLYNMKDMTYLINIIETKLTSYTVLTSDETMKYCIHSESNDKYIKKVLSPLMYPIKMKHYDEMYDRISGMNCTSSETTQYIIVKDNITKIISLIFNDGIREPDRWFKFYNYNIGKEDKCDSLHMFPFVLDKNLSRIKCYEKHTFDMVNKFGKVHLIYFIGMLIYNKKRTIGLYEYFFDATGSLFHRFFRPYDQISDKMKIIVMQNFSSDFKDKYNMANELIKSF